jgi:hypothetical protein
MYEANTKPSCGVGISKESNGGTKKKKAKGIESAIVRRLGKYPKKRAITMVFMMKKVIGIFPCRKL